MDPREERELTEGYEELQLDAEVEIGTLVVRLIAARNIKAAVEGSFYGLLSSKTSNGFCRLQVADNIQMSSTVKQTLQPQWKREQFFFPIVIPSECILGKAKKKIDQLGTEINRGWKKGSTDIKQNMQKGKSSHSDRDCDSKRFILFIEMFHEENPSRESNSKTGISLGVSELDFSDLIMGRDNHIDQWITLSAGGDCRLSVDYEPGGPPLEVSGFVRLLQLGHPFDLYPLNLDSLFKVQSIDLAGLNFFLSTLDHSGVIISYDAVPGVRRSGWKCYVEVPRTLVYALPKREQWTIESTRKAVAAFGKRLVEAPAGIAINNALVQVQTNGIINGGIATTYVALKGAVYLMWRWAFGIRVSRIVDDVRFALGLASILGSSEREADVHMSGTGSSCSSKSLTKNETENDDATSGSGICVLCLTEEKRVVLLPCGHLCLCQSCTRNLMKEAVNRCPVCRAEITSVQVVYL